MKRTAVVKEEEEERGRKKQQEEEVVAKVEPNFALSGLLAADRKTGNLQKEVRNSSSKETVVSKYSRPADEMPPAGGWRLFVFPPPNNKDQTDKTLYLHRKSHFVFGKQTELTDFDLEEDEDANEPTLDGEHAVLQYRKEEGKLYLIDLNSKHGTKLNGDRIVPARYVELLDGDMITFGESKWEFIVKRPSTK